MKITKRQLKRIIREEYSRLKRRGLIKESWDDESIGQSFNAMSTAYGQSPQGQGSMGSACMNLSQEQLMLMVCEICEANPAHCAVCCDLIVANMAKDSVGCDECLEEICKCPTCQEICAMHLGA